MVFAFVKKVERKEEERLCSRNCCKTRGRTLMKSNERVNKEEVSYFVIRELKWLGDDKKVIPFPLIFEKLCPTLHLRKNELRLVLAKLEKQGLIEIHSFRGVRILR